MLKQKKNTSNEENFGVKIGIILLALILIIATYIIIQRSIRITQTTVEPTATTETFPERVVVEAIAQATSIDAHPGLFLIHCHNLEHEDMSMMRNYLIEGENDI